MKQIVKAFYRYFLDPKDVRAVKEINREVSRNNLHTPIVPELDTSQFRTLQAGPNLDLIPSYFSARVYDEYYYDPEQKILVRKECTSAFRYNLRYFASVKNFDDRRNWIGQLTIQIHDHRYQDLDYYTVSIWSSYTGFRQSPIKRTQLYQGLVDHINKSFFT